LRPGRILRRRRWLGGALLGTLAATLTLGPRRAPATIEEQRARLPAPAECRDPVEGVWRSHAFNEMWGEWNIFTLTVRRVAPGSTQLHGTITNEAWYGPATEVSRGPCEGRLQYLVSMDGTGSVTDGRIAFGGTGQWRLDQLYCGSDDFGYNLDQFAGTIDPALLEFQSVNNDGGRYIDVPTVFRRVECLDDPTAEPVAVALTPPPFYPPSEAGGVGCGCGP
jgi:hypothetical protein